MLMAGIIIYVCLVIWIVWEAINSPQVDDEGNVIDKK